VSGLRLMEDVAADGILITCREPDLGKDTGLRFAALNQHAFRCPACGGVYGNRSLKLGLKKHHLVSANPSRYPERCRAPLQSGPAINHMPSHPPHRNEPGDHAPEAGTSAGTRIPVVLLLRKLSERATEGELLDAYPRLTVDDLRAALAYAADTLAHEETVNHDSKAPAPKL